MSEKQVSLAQIFGVFAKIGAFTIGGGYMMVPAIEAEITRRGWLKEEDMPDMVAISQSAPGLLTVNMAVFTGHRLRGLKGSIAATTGVLIAPFFIILAIAMFFAGFKDNAVVEAIFKGVRPVAVAIIAAYTVKLLKRNAHWWQWIITIGTLVALVVLKISAVYILLTVIIFACAIGAYQQSRARGGSSRKGNRRAAK